METKGGMKAVSSTTYLTRTLELGALDAHSDKRFASFLKDSKQVDPEVHRKYIYGGHSGFLREDSHGG